MGERALQSEYLDCESDMGGTITEVRIRGPKNSAVICALVDTCATNTVLSESLERIVLR